MIGSMATTKNNLVAVARCCVPGCPRPIRDRGRKLCAMHELRVRRTGKVGPADSYFDRWATDDSYDRPSRLAAARDLFKKLLHVLGRGQWLLDPGRGFYMARSKAGGTPIRVGTRAMLGLQARGWVDLGEYKGRCRRARPTKAGLDAQEQAAA